MMPSNPITTSIKLAAIGGLAVLAMPTPSLADGHGNHHTSAANPEATTLTITVNLTSTQGVGSEVGTVTFENTAYGLLVKPNLQNLTPPGQHGFHIHANPSCGPGEKDGTIVPGLAAGGHYDPLNSGFHGGPYQNGHLGDLPPLYVETDGSASTPVLAPRLNLANVLDRSLIIHYYGDNFSDDPKPLGGGGPRLACGVIPATLAES